MGITTLHEQAGDRVSPITRVYQSMFAATTGWTILADDTENLATDVSHIVGTKSLEFDKTDGLANTIFAGVSRTVDWDWSGILPTDHIIAGVHVDTADVVYAFVRLGTDVSNFTQWQYPIGGLLDSLWNMESVLVGEATSQTGNGVLWDAITYLAVGVAFSAEGDSVTDIFWNYVGFQRSLLVRT